MFGFLTTPFQPPADAPVTTDPSLLSVWSAWNWPIIDWSREFSLGFLVPRFQHLQSNHGGVAWCVEDVNYFMRCHMITQFDLDVMNLRLPDQISRHTQLVRSSNITRGKFLRQNQVLEQALPQSLPAPVSPVPPNLTRDLQLSLVPVQTKLGRWLTQAVNSWRHRDRPQYLRCVVPRFPEIPSQAVFLFYVNSADMLFHNPLVLTPPVMTRDTKTWNVYDDFTPLDQTRPWLFPRSTEWTMDDDKEPILRTAVISRTPTDIVGGIIDNIIDYALARVARV